ncbi:MAG: ISNCY family transposase [Crocinitomicaceae bacterium]|nr:ISNCY family transposase [Crocinitomicaceae bacterium]
MRKFTSTQGELGENPLLGVIIIENIKLDPNCRDEITKTLRGLKEIYREKPLLKKIETVLHKLIPEGISWDEGRQGMDIWVIFVLGTLRLSCNWDFDKLKNCFDNHRKIREIAGVDCFCDFDSVIGRQTLHDNISLFTPEIAKEINKLVVDFGHNFLFPKEKELETRCDSFVFETNVHFPTDFNLLKDSVRKILSIGSDLAKSLNMSGWRETKSQLDKFQSLYNSLSKMRHSNSQKEEQKEKRRQKIEDAVRDYLKVAQTYLLKAKALYKCLNEENPELELHIDYTELFINQISRRVLNGETIAADEKIYSIFEPHTEWICKGKAGVRQELGVKVCIVEDQFGFILNHRIMNKEQDKDIAVEMTRDVQKLFPMLKSISFDKGFYSKKDKDGNNNQSKIEMLNVTAHLPVKGRRNKDAETRENSAEFIVARKQHPAVESAINALESHGFDRCPDKGSSNFERYAAMAISASNIHHIGAIIMARELEAERKRKRSA